MLDLTWHLLGVARVRHFNEIQFPLSASNHGGCALNGIQPGCGQRLMGASALSNESEGRRKWTTFGSMFIGWSFIYLCRKVFVTTMPQLIEYRGFDKQDLGAIASSFSLSYGLSKFFSAVLSDHVSPRMLLGAGVGLSGMCVLLFPLSTSLWLCCVMWFALGVVQGFGWPACTKLLKAWFPPTSVGTWWSILSSSGNLAAACAPVLITYTSTQTSWQSSYYVIGGLCCLVAAVFMVTVTDTPRQSNASLQQKKPQPTSRASWSFLIRSRELWLISIVYAILGNVKASLLDWGQLFFVDHAHFSNQSGEERWPGGAIMTLISVCVISGRIASTLIGATQVGGMLGSVVWGYVSDIVLSKVCCIWD